MLDPCMDTSQRVDRVSAARHWSGDLHGRHQRCGVLIVAWSSALVATLTTS